MCSAGQIRPAGRKLLTLDLAQSDPIKWRPLYKTNKSNKKLKQNKQNKMTQPKQNDTTKTK